MTNTKLNERAEALGITVDELKARIATLYKGIDEDNKTNKRVKATAKMLERRSMIKAVEKLEELGKEYEITLVDVVEHERDCECGTVHVCAHKRAVVTVRR